MYEEKSTITRPLICEHVSMTKRLDIDLNRSLTSIDLGLAASKALILAFTESEDTEPESSNWKIPTAVNHCQRHRQS